MAIEDNQVPNEILKIREATLRSGEVISVAEGLTVVVGPNNAGKSQLLRELNERMSGPTTNNHRPKVLDSIAIERRCSADELMHWLGSRYKSFEAGQHGHGFVSDQHFVTPNSGGQSLSYAEIRTVWTNPHPYFVRLTPYLLGYIGPGHASGSIGNSGLFHVSRETPSTPLQHLYMRRDLEKSLSEEMRNAFGESLVLHRYAGSQISLHVGTVASPESPPPASPEYLAEIESLPLLQDQGDGVKSYIGMVLTILVAKHSVLILDEPETFLHPPQAYMLGQFLARQRDNGSQVIVATHSSDIMRGIVSIASSNPDVTIVRLTRSSAGNHAAQVHVEEVKRLYDDPLIKYYGILDGLFFHGVILCEADSDCTYYRAVIETTLSELADGRPASSLNLHFAHCAGKTRIPNAVRALRAARVPVACAVDIDFLQDKTDFVKLIDACGGNYSAFEGYRNVVVAALQSQGTKPKRSVAQIEIDNVLRRQSDKYLTSAECEQVRQAVQSETGWKLFKKVGKNLLSGGVREAYDRIDEMLQELGVFLVPLGELECFHKEFSAANKAQWLRDVLENRSYAASAEATAYVERLANFIWQHQDQSATKSGAMVGSFSDNE